MNKRLQELYNKALVQHTSGGTMAWEELDPKKFAELIIKDCIELTAPCECGCLGPEVSRALANTVVMFNEHFFDIQPPARPSKVGSE